MLIPYHKNRLRCVFDDEFRDNFSYFFIKNNLMSTLNIGFYEEMARIFFLLSLIIIEYRNGHKFWDK